MPSRSSHREEEFELVLGNKQLLSLFFIVVGFFAAFFSVGYMVGFGHGEKTADAAGMARVEEPAPKPQEPRLPATLMQEPPEPAPATQAVERPKPSPAPAAAAPAATPAPVQQAAAEKPKQTTPEKPSPAAPTPAAAKPEPKPATPKPAPSAAAAAAAGSYFLQVAAVTEAADADRVVGQLKAKGYPASVNTSKGDGWQRVVVGPFSSAEAAQAFETKLHKDGFDTMLRKL